jgi:hypothetical protein
MILTLKEHDMTLNISQVGLLERLLKLIKSQFVRIMPN